SIESSIVSGNAGSGADIASTTMVSLKNSAIGNASGFSGVDQGGNLPFGTALNLGPLQNNGGPTFTRALLSGSPCLNAGSNPANLTTDQRGAGNPRAANGAPDIGAFEAQ